MHSSYKKPLFLALFVLLGVGPLGFAQDFDQIQIQTVKVTENIYMLAGGGGNIGVLVGPDAVLLIDSQFGQLMEKIEAAVAKVGGGPIRFVCNTNWHYDHVSGNELLAKSGAVIIAHEKTRQRMAGEQYFPELDLKTPPYPEAALPAMTFNDALMLHFNGEEIQAIHIPRAHSDADLVFYFRKANVLHAGDICFSKVYPFIDVTNGGSVNGVIEAVDKVCGMIDANTKVIPGHGPLTNLEGLKAFRDMLAAVRDRIANLIKEGKTLEQVLAAKPTADFDKLMLPGMPAETFVRVVYNDLAKK